jgi:hypothetical protein
LPFALLWVLIAMWLGREYRRRDASGDWSEVNDENDKNALEST